MDVNIKKIIGRLVVESNLIFPFCSAESTRQEKNPANDRFQFSSFSPKLGSKTSKHKNVQSKLTNLTVFLTFHMPSSANRRIFDADKLAVSVIGASILITVCHEKLYSV
jgi:hypothetical protein